jgi:SP family arabinose:H+ symporter-like MFS transporter
MMWIVAIVGSLAGFLFGYDEGIIAGALPLVTHYFAFSATEEGVMTSALPLGALIGSMIIGMVLASKLSSRIGRKSSLMLSGVLFVIGAVIEALSITDSMIVGARLILGLAIGTASVSTPLLLSESAPTKSRGAMIAIYQLAITVGIIMAYLVNYLLLPYNNWRLMFASSIIPALLLIIGLFFIPESPRWLLNVGRSEESIAALKRLRSHQSITDELTEMRKMCQHTTTTYWKPLFKSPLSAVLFMGMGLFALQQLSGINVIIYYAPEIFKSFAISDRSVAILATLGIGIVNMLVTLLAIIYVDKIGRKKLLLFGFFGTCLSLFVLAVGSLHTGHFTAILSMICLTGYIISFAISLGPIPYIIMAELFPSFVRGAGMGLSSMSNWGFNYLMILSFPILNAHISIHWIFGLYAAICFIGFFFTYRYMPETKNFSLESIETYVMSNKPLRHLGKDHV